jgi:hypothetical protein
MEKQLMQMLEETKKNKKAFRWLKNVAVRTQQFELAASLRQIENENFPETEETKKAKKRAKDLNFLFRMVDLNVPEKMCWMLDELIKAYDKKKGKFSIDDAVTINYKNKDIFDLDEEH